LRNRLAIHYAVEGDLRFISHQDTLRLFRRSLTRAGVPLRYSEGFNPRPRVRIALPRPVGVATLSDLLVVELISDEDPETLLMRVAAQVPEGMRLLQAERLDERDRRLPCSARYSLELDPRKCESVAQSAAEFLAKESVLVRRTIGQGPAYRDINIRVFITSMKVSDGELGWAQAISPNGTARIGEVLDNIGLSGREFLHRVVRRQTTYET